MTTNINAALREKLIDLISEHLSGTYHCTRVWAAWGVGTMSQDDFEDVGESDTPAELADAILAAISTAAVPVQITAPQNIEEETQLIVRWLVETPAGRVGAWNRASLEYLLGNIPAQAAPAAKAAPQPAIHQGDDAAALNEIADIFQIGSKARKDRWCILENVRNSFRREQCLSRIEHSYFTVPRPPEGGDEEDEGGGGEECLLNWGDEPDEYAKRFGEALAQIAEPTPATQRDARLWCVHIHGPDDVHAMPSRAAALERANELNEIFGQHPHEEGDPIMRAVVIEWPHSANAHKQDLADAARAAKEGDRNG